jgi:hypothetical protein
MLIAGIPGISTTAPVLGIQTCRWVSACRVSRQANPEAPHFARSLQDIHAGSKPAVERDPEVAHVDAVVQDRRRTARPHGDGALVACDLAHGAKGPVRERLNRRSTIDQCT